MKLVILTIRIVLIDVYEHYVNADKREIIKWRWMGNHPEYCVTLKIDIL